MYSNQVWDLVKAPNDIKPIGCKWVYKRKRGIDGKVETFKARLMAKGYTQKEGIDYEETFSPVAMLKSIIILLSIAAHYDYENWQMDVKIEFLNGNLEKEIYMMQPEGFMAKNQEHMDLNKYLGHGTLDLIQQSSHLVLNKILMNHVCTKDINLKWYLVLYVDDILLIGNYVGVMSSIKVWLSSQFDMKDLGEVNFILGIKL